MDSTARTAIISAAITATGPQTAYTVTQEVQRGDETVTVEVPDLAAWNGKVQENAVAIMVMAQDNSSIAKALDSIEKAKVFPGTVMAVKKERSSTRGVITLHTGTDRTREGVPEGCEQVRTERTDNVMGLAMAKKMRDLVGHRVVVWVEVEEYNGGQGKVRVLKHVEDLGVDPEFAEKQAA